MAKIKLPHNVVRAIDDALNLDAYPSTQHFLLAHAKAILEEEPWAEPFECLNDVGILLMSEALVNGYEIEKTPEENIKEFYEAHVNDSSYRSRGICIGIVGTLEKLRIKIEGVNT